MINHLHILNHLEKVGIWEDLLETEWLTGANYYFKFIYVLTEL